ncbi:MAG: tRNA (adenosine(37)-N6)-threonylcarbamoyltransferase complex ATPase subunit type 1 TsaE [Helicobacteraceae bacterium]|jgi:tRNA threonylcarbamoyladenosine biosynthesis protein TsaE|nr:tRNA (adenosine(37)-N6)-threonylcarbamoyltransferase complex ATPase subunit type 1 TsaE [Helicobacteraceae bacterium]
MLYKAPLTEDYDPICRDLISRYKDGAVVLLDGVLGSGKTAFVKRFALCFGAGEAASPTFGIMHEYAPGFRHFDLYRVGGRGFFEHGLHEFLGGGWAFIEWADASLVRFLREEEIEFLQIAFRLEGNCRALIYE